MNTQNIIKFIKINKGVSRTDILNHFKITNTNQKSEFDQAISKALDTRQILWDGNKFHNNDDVSKNSIILPSWITK